MQLVRVLQLARVLLLGLLSLSVWAAPPNIIIFVLDDVGQQDIGTFGNPVVRTPNMDQLAREGMRFDNAFLSTSSCSPSRASLLTGLYPSATGAPNLDDPVPATITSLPQLLHRAGYYTASVGKWHLGEPFKAHFDRVVEPHEESGSADWLPELARRPHDKPFFFWLASKDAHEPYFWNPPLLRQDPKQVLVPEGVDDNKYTRDMIASYYDEIARADGHIGQVLAALRGEGVLDNTLVMVLSDNGSQVSGAKTTLYDSGLKTPLIMRFPQRIAMGVSNVQLVSAVDVMPTVLALAGVPLLASAPGVSLWPTLQNPSQPVRDYIYAEQNRHGQPHFERAVRTRSYLFKRNYLHSRLCDPSWDAVWDPDSPKDQRHEEFYDLLHDPQAKHNSLDDPRYQSQRAEAHTILARIFHETRQQSPQALVLEHCPQRPWHERIRWQKPMPEEG
ncbi:MAG: sulfatase [Pseudomonadales bacterium]|nr:sulfatase [Pseudomonadales bacterium]